MKTNILFLFAISLFLFSCSKTIGKINTTDAKQFGATVEPKKVYAYEDMVKMVKNDGGFEGQVLGNIQAVCQVKGCWMNIVSDQIEDEMFVKFKDYGFFMPLDCTGGKVIMDGKAYMETTSVEELQHYAEDEGLAQEEIDKITEPEEELKFMATGVLLLNK